MGKGRMPSFSQGNSDLTGALAIGAVSGGGTYMRCDEDDTGLACTLTRYKSILSNILFFVGIAFLMYMGMKMYGPNMSKLLKNKKK